MIRTFTIGVRFNLNIHADSITNADDSFTEHACLRAIAFLRAFQYYKAMHTKINPNQDKPGYFTVVPQGPIDSDTYLDFDAKIKPLLSKSTKGIILDLAQVDYISSAGLGVLFAIKKFFRENGGDLLFCNLKPQIVRLFEVVNALPKETLFKNTEEADAYLYRIMNKEIEDQGKGGKKG